MSLNAPLIDVRLASVRFAAEEMKLYELVPAQGSLPVAEPGAHIDVHLPTGAGPLVRQYSLVSASANAYVLGIKREAAGRGGSSWLHDQAQAGQALQISAPRNHFALNPQATHSILIAGGIGITPIWAMAQHLQAHGASWELHYGCRSQAHCAFHDQLVGLGDKVHFYFDDVLGPGAIDFTALAAKAGADARGDAGTHLYCCGPQGMLDAYQRGCASLPSGRAHLEHFSAPASDAAASGTFVVELARSGKEIVVPAGKTILECLTEIGIDVPYSCSQGVCGSCETRVIAGTPDHRDVVLSDEERAASTTMMVCCSRARSPRITLDL